VQSAATMLTYGARLGYYSTDPDFYIDYWTDRVERLLSAAVRDLHFVPDDQRIDVPFDEFMADDVAMVERIYDLAGMTMTGTARAQMDAHMATHPRDKYGRIVFDLRGDFGVEPEEVRERFKVYIDRFAVPIEVK
jgi:Sulfotransferase family